MAIKFLKDAVTDFIRVVKLLATPTTPDSGYGLFYNKNGVPAFLNDAGTETIMVGQTPYIKVSDVKAANTDGGTFTQDAWRTRDINTEDTDTHNLCSIGSNQITLLAGTYRCSISVPAFTVTYNKAILYSITDASNVLIGSSEYAGAVVNGSGTRSLIVGMFTIAATKVFEIRHYCIQTGATAGFGIRANVGVSEVYTIAEFWKVA